MRNFSQNSRKKFSLPPKPLKKWRAWQDLNLPFGWRGMPTLCAHNEKEKEGEFGHPVQPVSCPGFPSFPAGLPRRDSPSAVHLAEIVPIVINEFPLSTRRRCMAENTCLRGEIVQSHAICESIHREVTIRKSRFWQRILPQKRKCARSTCGRRGVNTFNIKQMVSS